MKAARVVFAFLAVMFWTVWAQAEPYKMRISHQMPETHHISQNVKHLKELVEEKTKGQVQVEIYPAAQAFKPNEIIKAVVTGGIEAGISTNFQWAGMLPVMDVFLIPWLITDLGVIEKALEGEPGSILFKAMESKGVVPLMWYLQCRTNLYTSNKSPLIMPADFKGKKMRGTSKIMNLGSEAMGAATTPISGPEVYMALQRGTIDIGLTGIDTALARHYYEIQKYGTAVSDFTVVHPMFINPKFWSSLPEETRKVVQECAAVVQKKCIQDSEKARIEALAGLKEKMTIHVQTDEEAAAWKEVMREPVLKYFYDKTGEGGKQLAGLLADMGK